MCWVLRMPTNQCWQMPQPADRMRWTQQQQRRVRLLREVERCPWVIPFDTERQRAVCNACGVRVNVMKSERSDEPS